MHQHDVCQTDLITRHLLYTLRSIPFVVRCKRVYDCMLSERIHLQCLLQVTCASGAALCRRSIGCKPCVCAPSYHQSTYLLQSRLVAFRVGCLPSNSLATHQPTIIVSRFCSTSLLCPQVLLVPAMVCSVSALASHQVHCC